MRGAGIDKSTDQSLGCKAIALHKATKDIMEEYDIADQKIVGFGSDGTSVMAEEMGS